MLFSCLGTERIFIETEITNGNSKRYKSPNTLFREIGGEGIVAMWNKK
jgi:hypothetical protein